MKDESAIKVAEASRSAAMQKMVSVKEAKLAEEGKPALTDKEKEIIALKEKKHWTDGLRESAANFNSKKEAASKTSTHDTNEEHSDEEHSDVSDDEDEKLVAHFDSNHDVEAAAVDGDEKKAEQLHEEARKAMD